MLIIIFMTDQLNKFIYQLFGLYNVRKSPSQFPTAQCDVFNLLVVNISDNRQQISHLRSHFG